VIEAGAPAKEPLFDAQHGREPAGRVVLVDFNADDATEERVGIAARRPFEADPTVMPGEDHPHPPTVRMTCGRSTQAYCRQERRMAHAAKAR